MGDTKNILITIIMILDIIVGAFAVFVGANSIWHFINDGLDDLLMSAL